MLNWSAAPFLRLALALILGITAYLYLGESWAGSAAPWAAGLVLLYSGAWAATRRRPGFEATDTLGPLGCAQTLGLLRPAAPVALGYRRPLAAGPALRPPIP